MAPSLFQNFCTASSTKTTMFLSLLGFPSVFCSPALTCSPRVPLALRRDFSRSRTISHLEACHALATFSRSAPPLATLAPSLSFRPLSLIFPRSHAPSFTISHSRILKKLLHSVNSSSSFVSKCKYKSILPQYSPNNTSNEW